MQMSPYDLWGLNLQNVGKERLSLAGPHIENCLCLENFVGKGVLVLLPNRDLSVVGISHGQEAKLHPIIALFCTVSCVCPEHDTITLICFISCVPLICESIEV